MRQEIEQNRFLRFFQVFVYAHALNFGLFIVILEMIGGSSTWGFQKGEHYFVGNHGHYVEVSEQLYQFSKIHAEYTITTMVICIVAGIILKFSGYSPVKKISLKEWMLAATVPIFWLITFLIVR
jgi:hypothetical protein